MTAPAIPVRPVSASAILLAWQNGLDTWEISKRLGAPEYVIERQLHCVLALLKAEPQP